MASHVAVVFPAAVCGHVASHHIPRAARQDGDQFGRQFWQPSVGLKLVSGFRRQPVATFPRHAGPAATFPRQCRPRTVQRGRSSRQIGADANREAPDSSAATTAGTTTSSGDELISALSTNAEVSVFVVVGTQLVREAQSRHQMAPTATAALGRLLLGTLLLGAVKGPEETVQVTFAGRGQLGQMTAITSEGEVVKGFASNPLCDPPLNAQGKMDVGAAVGPGVLTVVRSHPSWQMPYTGTVPLQSGEVAEDLAHYLAESEQINSAISLGVSVGRDGVVRAAGGFIVQVLPFCSEETLRQLEANVGSMPPMSDLVIGSSAASILERLMEGIGKRGAGEPVVPRFGPCSLEDLRPRMLRAVGSLGPKDVRELLEEQGHVEVRCEFCSEKVRFEEGDLQSILAPPSEASEASEAS